MRIFCLALTLAVCFGIAGCDNGDSSRIGVVDLNRLMTESEPGKAGLGYIETRQKALQAKLDEIQDRIEKNPNDEAAMQELQTVYAASQQRIQSEGQAVVTRLLEAIQKTVDSFRKENGYAMLLRREALDSLDPALDVTSALMVEVNRLQLDFATPEAAGGNQTQEKAGEAAADPVKTDANQKK